MKGTKPTGEERHTAILLEQELTETRESLKAVSTEKDETNKQYQNYVKQLDMQQAKLLNEVCYIFLVKKDLGKVRMH